MATRTPSIPLADGELDGAVAADNRSVGDLAALSITLRDACLGRYADRPQELYVTGRQAVFRCSMQDDLAGHAGLFLTAPGKTGSHHGRLDVLRQHACNRGIEAMPQVMLASSVRVLSDAAAPTYPSSSSRHCTTKGAPRVELPGPVSAPGSRTVLIRW
ncbi:hypothetical protein [Streptomyces sp. 3213.3]|uniref:hypothetical protein n=1 Tax=Streptomyces sp. 3213.3 TaxID=1855348 RepID=UPI000B8892C7|nr:hypothetical protein [Streptomyces sp. 3213.3]